MGFGGGSVLIVFLTSYFNMPQRQAQGINLLFYLPIALFSVIRYKKDRLIDAKQIKSFLLPGFAGVGAGYAAAALMPTEYLKYIFAAFLIFTGIRQLFFEK